MKLINPAVLQPGDVVGIVAPSSGLAGVFPHRAERGEAMLREIGLQVKYGTYARQVRGYVSGTPEERASDIHAAFTDPEVKAILCTIGGNHANQVLKHLDFACIAANPKIFIGYSDITILHYAFAAKAHLQTFYGPALLPEFGEYPTMLPYTRDYFCKAVMQTDPVGSVAPSRQWTDEFLDWSSKEDQTRARHLKKNEGYEWWQEGRVEAAIFGGTIPTVNHLAGTEYWIDPHGMIFFIDIPEGNNPEEPFAVSELDAFLADLDNLGVFDCIAGLIIGRPYRYADNDVAALRDIIARYTQGKGYPILYNANIGHASPVITIPMGARVRLNSAKNEFAILEAGVRSGS